MDKKKIQAAMTSLAGYIDMLASIGALANDEANEMENSLQIIYQTLCSKELI